MRLAFGCDAQVQKLAQDYLGVVLCPPFVAIGVIDEAERVVGGLVYNNYNGFSIELTAFLPSGVKRGILKAALAYPFTQLNVLRLTARTKRKNKKIIKQLVRMGWAYEGTMKRYFGPESGDDAIIYRLDRETAQKWM